MSRKPNHIAIWRPRSAQPRGKYRRPAARTVDTEGSFYLVARSSETPFLATDEAHLHLRLGLGRCGANLGVPVGAHPPHPGELVLQLRVREAAAEERAQIVAAGREEA